MKRVLLRPVFSLLLIATAVSNASAIAFVADRGNWPEEWPQELEPLRPTSRTLGVGTGIQENIYEIPIPDRATFEKVWPAVLQVRTPGSPLTLYRTGATPPKAWGTLLSNERAAIRIYGPAGSCKVFGKLDPEEKEKPLDQLVEEGRAVRVQAPWPEYLIGENGELPEWAVIKKQDEGPVKWIPADPRNKETDDFPSFYYRIRIDVELVVDGEVIDLNRIEFPEGVTVFDKRFKQP